MLINKTRFANKISNITAFAFLFTLIILEFSNYVTGSRVNFAIFEHELGYEFLFIIRAWPWFVFGMICRQFVSMHRAGVTILETMRMLTEQTENTTPKRRVKTLPFSQMN